MNPMSVFFIAALLKGLELQPAYRWLYGPNPLRVQSAILSHRRSERNEGDNRVALGSRGGDGPDSAAGEVADRAGERGEVPYGRRKTVHFQTNTGLNRRGFRRQEAA